MELTSGGLGSVGAATRYRQAIAVAPNRPCGFRRKEREYPDARSRIAVRKEPRVSPTREMPSWSKSPGHLQEAFAAALDRFPDAERRQMFGYPAAFVNGNMWTGLHTTNWVVRLPEPAREELLRIDGARPFEPVPGRPMTGFATLPPSVLGNAAA